MPNKPFRDTRIIHRQVTIRPVGADGSAVATGTIPTGPGRVIAMAVDFQNQPAGVDLLLKRDNVDGATFFTRNDNTDFTQRPVGAPAVDEARGATAATDGFSGGFPVRGGVYYDVAQGDGQTSGDEAIVLDLWVKLDRLEVVTLVADAGADGTGTVSRTVNLNGAGNLAAIAIDFQNQPGATTDVVIKADSTSGATLFTSTDSATDLAPTLLGRPAMDEGGAATAATDGTGAGNVFKTGLRFECTGMDIFTSSNEKIIVECWIEQ